MIKVNFDVNNQKVLKKISELHGKIKNKAGLIHLIGVYMTRSIKDNFTAGGRPDKWEPLAAKTLWLRRYRVSRPTKSIFPLRDSGLTQASIHILRETKNEVAVGTSLKHAPLLNYGGMSKPNNIEVRVPAHTAYAHHSRYKVVSWHVKSATYTVHMKSNYVPARTFMMFQKEDIPAILTMAENFFDIESRASNA